MMDGIDNTYYIKSNDPNVTKYRNQSSKPMLKAANHHRITKHKPLFLGLALSLSQLKSHQIPSTMNRNSPPPPQSQSALAWAAWKILHSTSSTIFFDWNAPQIPTPLAIQESATRNIPHRLTYSSSSSSSVTVLLLLYFLLLRKCRSHLSRTYFVAALPQFARRGIFWFTPTPSIAAR